MSAQSKVVMPASTNRSMSASAAAASTAPWPPASCQPPFIRRETVVAGRELDARHIHRFTAGGSGTAVTSLWRKVRVPMRVMRNRAPQLGSGQAMSVSVVIQSCGCVTRCFAGKQRQQRRQRINGEGLRPRAGQVLAAQLEPVAGAMAADHRPIGGHHFDAQVVEVERVVRLYERSCGSLVGNIVCTGGAPGHDDRTDSARRADGERRAARRPLDDETGALAARREASAPTPLDLLIGFVTNFFDTLGIGSFATTTAVFRLFRLVPDELIPGTIIVGDALPVLAQAMIFISVVRVDPWQMTALIAVCVAGGWIGAGRRRLAFTPRGAARRWVARCWRPPCSCCSECSATSRRAAPRSAFTPSAFALALVVNFVLGALLTLGVGNYAPSLVVFSLLGMDPSAAFPIMMGRAPSSRRLPASGSSAPAASTGVRRWG